ncbi:MAG TPA: hypothetical protein VF432_31300 [Thermoanaerobaculia bacterium]
MKGLLRYRFELLGLLIAAVVAAATWREGERWSAQPLAVPLWIAVMPLLGRLARPSGDPPAAIRRRKAWTIFAGATGVQLLNVGLVLFADVPRSYAYTWIAITVSLQIVALYVALARPR